MVLVVRGYLKNVNGAIQWRERKKNRVLIACPAFLLPFVCESVWDWHVAILMCISCLEFTSQEKRHWSRGPERCFVTSICLSHMSSYLTLYCCVRVCVCTCETVVDCLQKAWKRPSNLPCRHYIERWAGGKYQEGMKGTEWAGMELDSTLGSYHFGLFSFVLFIYQSKDFLSLAQQQQPASSTPVISFQQVLIQDEFMLPLPMTLFQRSGPSTWLRVLGAASLPPLGKSAAFQWR